MENCSWLMIYIQFCWYCFVWELNRLDFAPTAMVLFVVSSLAMLSHFYRMLYFLSSLSLRFFLKFPFSSKMVAKSKFLLNSYNFASNRLFNQGLFYVFGILLAPTNSETYATYIALFSSIRSWIWILLSTQLILFTAHFTFTLGIPSNVFNCSFFSYTKI